MTNQAEQVKGVDPSEVRESVKGGGREITRMPPSQTRRGREGMSKGVK